MRPFLFHGLLAFMSGGAPSSLLAESWAGSIFWLFCMMLPRSPTCEMMCLCECCLCQWQIPEWNYWLCQMSEALELSFAAESPRSLPVSAWLPRHCGEPPQCGHRPCPSPSCPDSLQCIRVSASPCCPILKCGPSVSAAAVTCKLTHDGNTESWS